MEEKGLKWVPVAGYRDKVISGGPLAKSGKIVHALSRLSGIWGEVLPAGMAIAGNTSSYSVRLLNN